MEKWLGNVQRTLIAFFVLAAVGCATSGTMMDIDEYRYEEIQKVVKAKGTRTYSDIDVQTAHRAMLIALRNLNMTIEEQDADGGFILAKAPKPKPLTEEEWKGVKAQENKVLNSFNPFIFISTQGIDYAVNVITLERSDGSVEINLGMRQIRYKMHEGNLYGNSPEPSAVSLVFDKVWDEFERVEFIQAKTLGKINDGGSHNSDSRSNTPQGASSIGADSSSNRRRVESIGVDMMCDKSIQLKSKSSESELWELTCNDGETLSVRCFDDTCYLK